MLLCHGITLLCLMRNPSCVPTWRCNVDETIKVYPGSLTDFNFEIQAFKFTGELDEVWLQTTRKISNKKGSSPTSQTSVFLGRCLLAVQLSCVRQATQTPDVIRAVWTVPLAGVSEKAGLRQPATSSLRVHFVWREMVNAVQVSHACTHMTDPVT